MGNGAGGSDRDQLFAQDDITTPWPIGTSGSRRSYFLHKTPTDSLFLELWGFGQGLEKLMKRRDFLRKKNLGTDVRNKAHM